MPEILLLRFDAPLMSFGGVLVDQHGVTREFPASSMLTGLLGNALGYEHRQADRLDRLQSRLRYAVRRDRAGTALLDFQTVDLSQRFLQEGWTRSGKREARGGGDARTGTHIRYRHFLADAVYTVALTLVPAQEEPDLAALAGALAEPQRPLFLGRKPCLPSTPLALGRVQAATLLEALRKTPRIALRGEAGPDLAAWWPAEEGTGEGPSRLLPLTDRRDWSNQIHVGRRFLREGRLSVDEVTHAP
jgi:CRISPR system Cascade subunit CasD